MTELEFAKKIEKLGGTAYLLIFISSFITQLRRAADRPGLIAVLMCIASYFFHNMFCYQRLTCTPFIFVFIAVGMGIVRNGSSDDYAFGFGKNRRRRE